jgi:hypothetical protein
MASGQDDPPVTPTAGLRIKRRPNRTIDLTATEVALGDEEGPLTPQETASPTREPSQTVVDPEISAAAARAEKPPNEPPTPPAGSWLPSPLTWPLLEAGAAGGGLVLLVLVVLWFAGLFPTRGNGPNDVAARLVQVEARLQQISNVPVQASIDPKTVEALAARVGKLEASPAQPQATDPALAQRLAAAENVIQSFQANIADMTKRTDAATSAADAARSNTGAERSDIESLSNRMAVLERSTKAFEEDLGKRTAATGDRQVRLAVLAQALREAVERGDAYAAELAAVKPLMADPQALSPLESLAAQGVPTAAALTRELADILPAMQRLAVPPAEGGFLDRLQANAGRLVRVRPMDDVPGDDPAAVLARIEAKAGRSDIAGVVAEFAKLPAPIRAPAETWIKKAEARNAAIASGRRLASAALTALGKPTP